MSNNSSTIKIFSLLNSDIETSLSFNISEDKKILFSNYKTDVDVKKITNIDFWKDINSKSPDAILLPLCSSDLHYLKDNSDIDSSSMFDTNRPWQYINAAVIVVLTGDDIHDAVIAAQMDFDGIMTAPFADGHIQTVIKSAIERKLQKNKLNSRYQRLQKVFKVINQNRHILQNKVDLLCNDLVQNNKDIAGKMSEMSKAYDFQKSLTGEFDLKYMLHKALKHITSNHPNTNSAIYICETEKVEVMITDTWFDGEISSQQLEQCLKNSIIPATIEANETLIINNPEGNRVFPCKCREKLTGLSICGIPIRHSAHNEGILVLYRSNTMPFTPAEIEALAPIVTPMSRSIEAILNLQDMLDLV